MARRLSSKTKTADQGTLWRILAGIAKGEEPTERYPGSSPHTYVFSISQEGYDEPVRLTLELPESSIDKEAQEASGDRGDEAFRQEELAFAGMLPRLLRTHCGRFVAVHHGRIIDTDEDEFALARRIEDNHRSEFVLIRRVASGIPTDYFLESPESELL